MDRLERALSWHLPLALMVALLVSLPAWAQPPEPYTCRNGGFPGKDSEGFHNAVIVGAPGTRAHLFDDDIGCPAIAKCRTRTFLQPRTRVLTSLVRDGWVCVYHRLGESSDHHYAGWMKAEHLDIEPDPPMPGAADWVGTWKAWDDEIVITQSPASNELSAKGKAFWHSDVTDHFGYMSGTALPEGNHLHIVFHTCEVWMTLVGDRLMVRDNGECGGLNVRFDNVYFRHHQ